MSEFTTDEFWTGYDGYRRTRDNYVDIPSYVHPVYGTPLKEPYKRSTTPGGVTVNVVPQTRKATRCCRSCSKIRSGN